MTIRTKTQNNQEGDYFEYLPSEDLDRYSDVSSPYKISAYGADFTVSVLFEKLNQAEVIIPDFQRRYVWDKRRASRLIESFLLNIPVPSIFVFREPESQKLLVVDGNQRLTTIRYFMSGKFIDGKDFSLAGVQSQWEGKTFKTLSSQDQIKLKDSILRTVIFEQKDYSDNRSIYQIFERLNTETSPLREQEIRNALYHGNFNELLKKLNEKTVWRKLVGKNEPFPRMRDIELILRFLALYNDLEKYTKPMKQFLNDFMKKDRSLSEQKAKKYEELFDDTIELIYKGLGSDAFKIKSGINVALFDAISVGVAKVKPNFNVLRNTKNKLLTNTDFMEAVEKHTTDKDKITERIRQAENALSSKK